MKQFLILFFILPGFYGYCQDLVPAKSTHEDDTLKQIFLKGKVGLVHQNGKQILEPKYTGVRVEPLGIRFYDDELQGFLPHGQQVPIPANYKEILQVYGYFEGRTENGTIDLYYGTELIASDLDTEPLESDVLLESNLIVIRKDEKVGIIDQKGIIIVPMEYFAIDRIPSFSYTLNDHRPVNYILVLDKSDYFFSAESIGFLPLGEYVLQIAKADGSLISDSVFTEVSTINPEKNEISLKLSKRLAVLDNQFKITYSPYKEVTEFLEWKFCATGKEKLILNRYNEVVDSFADVQIPYKLSWIRNEADLETTYYDEVLFADFVYVLKPDGENYLTAIYDLRNQKVVSNFQKSLTFFRRGINPSGSTVWIYKDETGLMAFGLSTTGKSSAFEYQDIYQASQQFYAFKKAGETNYTLCELIGDSVFVERIPIEKTFGSLNYVGINTSSFMEYDPDLGGGFVDDFGNYYSYSTKSEAAIVSPFEIPFTIFRNASGKLGFISWGGKVVDLNADTLFQSSKSVNLIEYSSGGLWGAAHAMWGSAAKADQQGPGYFDVLEDLAFIYRLSENETHYVDEKGRVFYSTNTERTISKKGKHKGSEQYSDFGETGNEKFVVIPYAYSEILQTWSGVHFLAKGKNKKWGVITAFNDTLFPFRYDELKFTTKEQPFPLEFPYSSNYDEICYTRNGEFHGVLGLNRRKEIPPVYDRVEYVPNAAFVVNKAGKFGVYDYFLNERIQPVFDELFIASSRIGVYVLRARKGSKWYNVEFFEGKIPNQTEFLQMPAFELVINETGFVKMANGYEARDMNNLPIKGKTIADYLDPEQFRLIDGKIFIIDLKGKILYPEGLTNILILEDGRVISGENGVVYEYSTFQKNKQIFME
jgi:hypothetical protein